MTEDKIKEIKQNASKLYVSLQYSEGLLLMVRGYLRHNVKQNAERCLKLLSNFCKSVEAGFDEPSIEESENDIEMFGRMMDVFVKAEEAGKGELVNELLTKLEKEL